MRSISTPLRISIAIAANDARTERPTSNTVSISRSRAALAAGPRAVHDRAVSLSQIRYFVAVAEEGHVGRAAQRLHLAQPPVSRQIRALEDEIGTRLFVRTPRGMQLLPSGHAFLDHARGILTAVDRAGDAAREAARGGAEPGSAARWLRAPAR
jgi:hypothetical protein